MIKRILFFTLLLGAVNTHGMETMEEYEMRRDKEYEEYEKQATLLSIFSYALRFKPDFVRSALRQTLPNVNIKIPSGTTAEELVNIYDKDGKEGIARKLLSLGLNPNNQYNINPRYRATSALEQASCYGSVPLVTILLKAIKKSADTEALWHSVNKRPDSDIPDLLIQHGALLDNAGQIDPLYVQTMLVKAVEGGSLRYVRQALQLGATPNVNHNLPYYVGPTITDAILLLKTTRGKYSLPIITELIRWGLDLDNREHYIEVAERYNRLAEDGTRPLPRKGLAKVERLLTHPTNYVLGGNPAQQLLFIETHGRRSRTARHVWDTRRAPSFKVNKWTQELAVALKEKETYAYMSQLFETEAE